VEEIDSNSRQRRGRTSIPFSNRARLILSKRLPCGSSLYLQAPGILPRVTPVQKSWAVVETRIATDCSLYSLLPRGKIACSY
jgi:hypothetical protein